MDKSCYVYDSENTPVTNVNPTVAVMADVNEKSVLTVAPSECLESCWLDDHGTTVTIYNPKRYYYGPTANTANAELVGIWPTSALGHISKGVKVSGGGQVWRLDSVEEVESYFSLEGLYPAEPNEDGLYVDVPIYIEMTSSATVTSVMERPACGSGKFGLNLAVSALNPHFTSNVIRAIAHDESKWTQFDCDGKALSPGASTATGLMMLIRSFWVGKDIGSYSPVIEGSECSGDGIVGDELYNLGVGTAAYQAERVRADAKIGNTANGTANPYSELTKTLDDKKLAEALAKYHGGASASYWNTTQLRNGNWVREDNDHSDYADHVLGVIDTHAWVGFHSNDCPQCQVGGL